MKPDIPLHDIKPLVDVPDNSLWLFSAVVLFSILLLVAIIYFLLKLRKSKFDEKKLWLKELKNIDVNNAKEAAYAITEFGEKLLANSTAPELFDTLNERLEQFKYRKEVPNLDARTIELYNLFVESINA